MREIEWVKSFAPTVKTKLRLDDKCLSVTTAWKLPYANEIRAYKNTDIHSSDFMAYETDLLIIKNIENEIWIPRVIAETKFGGSNCWKTNCQSTKIMMLPAGGRLTC